MNIKLKHTKKSLSAALFAAAWLLSSTAVYAQDYPVVQMIKRNAATFAIDGNNSGADGQDVYLWSEDETNVNQQWYEIDRGNGYYSYQKLNTDYCLDGNRGGASGQNVYLWSCGAGNQNQHWLKVDTGGGYYRLQKRNAPEYSIDGNNGGENRQSIFLWESSDSNQNQQFQFNYLSETPTEPGCIEVNTINQFADYLNASNECVRMMPGTYRFDTSNVARNGLFSDPSVLLFTGSNNTFIFDGVTFEYDTDIFRQFDLSNITEFHVVGTNNTFRNLTMVDIGNTVPFLTALAVSMDGADNLVEGFDITVRGSYPYGYGDIFGKGGPRVLNHKKHSGVLIRGDRNHVKDVNLIMRAYGHGIFVQGANDAVIEGAYVEGELSTVSAVLAEEGSGSPADDVDFRTVWGYNLRDLPRDYRFSLQEDGIRAYTTGNIYGTDESRNTVNLTITDSTVKFMRSGVSIGWARGEKYIENVTTLGVENGYWVGSDARVVNSRGDSSVGPLISEDVYRDRSTIELTLLDNVVSKIGDVPSMFFGGDRHNITLKDGTTSYDSDIRLQMGGSRNGHRWLAGSGEEPPVINANGVVFDNQTPYPVVLGNTTSSLEVRSCGSVSNLGSNNSVSSGSNCN